MEAKINLLMFVVSIISMANAAKREGVVKFGTTISPDFKRMTGTVAPKCPDDFPFMLNNGAHCCKFGVKSLNCDGKFLTWSSELECCPNGMYIACPEESGVCYSAKKRGSAICNPVLSIASNSAPLDNRPDLFVAESVLTYKQCEVNVDKSYFLFHAEKENQNFVFDFGCPALFSEIVFRNTQNGHSKDRGTKDFKMESSYDMLNWTLLESGTFPHETNANACDLPLRNFTVIGHGRYFRFTAVNYHVYGAGLNFIDWKFE